MSKITVLGASGFIGSHLVCHIRDLGLQCETPDRNEDLRGKSLGTVIYCIGLTADWRYRIPDAVVAHVTKLEEIIRTCEFDTLVYLSTTRVYDHRVTETDEESALVVEPCVRNDLYNISKVMGESLALHCDKPCKVVRLSNVYGCDFTSENFLTDIIRDALTEGKVVLMSVLKSSKDYISIDVVSNLLLEIALKGKEKIYNVASGVNTTHHAILQRIHELTGASYCVKDTAPMIAF